MGYVVNSLRADGRGRCRVGPGAPLAVSFPSGLRVNLPLSSFARNCIFLATASTIIIIMSTALSHPHPHPPVAIPVVALALLMVPTTLLVAAGS